MKITSTKFDSVYIIAAPHSQDERGVFVKVFHDASWLEHNLSFKLAESYYSVSKKHVIRGMHFQIPPADHTKIVYVTFGSILDVVLDIRVGSPTYGEFFSQQLSSTNHLMMYIPAGFAHGFLALEDNTSVTYLQTTRYSPDHDKGIQIDSFDMNWGITNPIMSQRDKSFPSLASFKSPFIYKPYETSR